MVELPICKLPKLKEAYENALNNEQDEFQFEGIDFHTPYVKYLLIHYKLL